MNREKELIRNILRENVVMEDGGQPAPQYGGGETTEKATDGDYERVRSILDNDLINHAGVILRLWGSKDATKRSLFRKKLHKEANDDGGLYEFDKEEMTKLISILDNLSKDVTASLTRGDG